jgi:hypothetical protein
MSGAGRRCTRFASRRQGPGFRQGGELLDGHEFVTHVAAVGLHPRVPPGVTSPGADQAAPVALGVGSCSADVPWETSGCQATSATSAPSDRRLSASRSLRMTCSLTEATVGVALI